MSCAGFGDLRPPRRFPRDNHAKALAFQYIRKARTFAGDGR